MMSNGSLLLQRVNLTSFYFNHSKNADMPCHPFPLPIWVKGPNTATSQGVRSATKVGKTVGQRRVPWGMQTWRRWVLVGRIFQGWKGRMIWTQIMVRWMRFAAFGMLPQFERRKLYRLGFLGSDFTRWFVIILLDTHVRSCKLFVSSIHIRLQD